MAKRCKEIQERIEETRQEAHEECRNVTRTITERICDWLPWPLDDICDWVSRVVTEVVCGIVWVIVTIVSWVTRIVCEIIFVLEWVINHIIGILEWLVNRIITFPEWLICLAGVGTGTKRFRICPLVIADGKGNPVVPVATIEAQIARAKEIYKQCSISVIASPVTVVTGRSYLANVSGCDADGYFSSDRIELDSLSCCEGLIESIKCLRFPSGLIWPRHVLKAVWVSSLADGRRGCYLLPESYIVIAATGAEDTLAHEMGHAGDLLHRDETDNLMATPTRTGSDLTDFQCCTVRTSRFVTIL